MHHHSKYYFPCAHFTLANSQVTSGDRRTKGEAQAGEDRSLNVRRDGSRSTGVRLPVSRRLTQKPFPGRR
jgi:hypothetical protein